MQLSLHRFTNGIFYRLIGAVMKHNTGPKIQRHVEMVGHMQHPVKRTTRRIGWQLLRAVGEREGGRGGYGGGEGRFGDKKMGPGADFNPEFQRVSAKRLFQVV